MNGRKRKTIEWSVRVYSDSPVNRGVAGHEDEWRLEELEGVGAAVVFEETPVEPKTLQKEEED